MTTWDAVKVGLDARAEGRESDALAVFEREIDVAYKKRTYRKVPARPDFTAYIVSGYIGDDYAEIPQYMSAEDAADERRRCRLINDAPWDIWVTPNRKLTTLGEIYKRRYSWAEG